jgi:hypothetical protein
MTTTAPTTCANCSKAATEKSYRCANCHAVCCDGCAYIYDRLDLVSEEEKREIKSLFFNPDVDDPENAKSKLRLPQPEDVFCASCFRAIDDEFRKVTCREKPSKYDFCLGCVDKAKDMLLDVRNCLPTVVDGTFNQEKFNDNLGFCATCKLKGDGLYSALFKKLNAKIEKSERKLNLVKKNLEDKEKAKKETEEPPKKKAKL